MSDNTESGRFCKLFVTHLNDNVTNKSLKSYFKQWGEITDCHIVCYPRTKKPRGYGFVTYKSAHMIDDVQAARPHYIDGQVVQTRRAIRPEDSGKPGASATVKTLFVSGIEEDFGEKDLQEYFGPYGTIVNMVLIKRDGKNKSFAFVEFDDYDPVDKILLQHHFFKGTELFVSKSCSRFQRAKITMRTEMEVLRRGGFCGDSYGGGYASGYSDNGRYARGRHARGFSDNGFGGGYARGFGYNCFGGEYGPGRGGWFYSYDHNYPSVRGGCTCDNFGPSYSARPVRGNTGFPQRSRDGGRRRWFR